MAKRRAIEAGPLVWIIGLIVAVAAIGIAVAVYFGMLRFGAGRASVSAVAIGEAAPDGTSGVIRITVYNSGDAAARIYNITVEPGSGVPSPTVSVFPSVNITVGNFTGPASVSGTPSGVDVPARGNVIFTIRLTGTVMPGYTYKIYLHVFDMGSRATTFVEVPITLR